MFTKLTRIDTYGEKQDTVIDIDDITSIFQKHVEDVCLYDGDGNVVETKTAPKTYEVWFKNTRHIRIDEANYNALLKLLIPTTKSPKSAK